jgi:hypothetical protein
VDRKLETLDAIACATEAGGAVAEGRLGRRGRGRRGKASEPSRSGCGQRPEQNTTTTTRAETRGGKSGQGREKNRNNCIFISALAGLESYAVKQLFK